LQRVEEERQNRIELLETEEERERRGREGEQRRGWVGLDGGEGDRGREGEQRRGKRRREGEGVARSLTERGKKKESTLTSNLDGGIDFGHG
jgi:hypothetical protein